MIRRTLYAGLAALALAAQPNQSEAYMLEFNEAEGVYTWTAPADGAFPAPNAHNTDNYGLVSGGTLEWRNTDAIGGLDGSTASRAHGTWSFTLPGNLIFENVEIKYWFRSNPNWSGRHEFYFNTDLDSLLDDVANAAFFNRTWNSDQDLTEATAVSYNIEDVLSDTIYFNNLIHIEPGAEDHRQRFRGITITATVIPEPSSLGLAGLGALCLLRRRRRLGV